MEISSHFAISFLLVTSSFAAYAQPKENNWLDFQYVEKNADDGKGGQKDLVFSAQKGENQKIGDLGTAILSLRNCMAEAQDFKKINDENMEPETEVVVRYIKSNPRYSRLVGAPKASTEFLVEVEVKTKYKGKPVSQIALQKFDGDSNAKCELQKLFDTASLNVVNEIKRRDQAQNLANDLRKISPANKPKTKRAH